MKLDNDTQNSLKKALNSAADTKNILCGAIISAMVDIRLNDEKNLIKLNDVVDCATCEPFDKILFDEETEDVYAISYHNDEPTNIDELTLNELLEIVKVLNNGEYVFKG